MRREKLRAALDPWLKNEDLLLIFCGEPLSKPGGLDQVYDFLPHPEYFWLTGLRKARGLVAYSKATGWEDYFSFSTPEEKLWEGSCEEEPSFKARDIAEFEAWFAKQTFSRVLCLGQVPQRQQELEKAIDSEFRFRIQESFNQVRRKKDTDEIALIRNAADMALRGYVALPELIRPGVTERQIQIEYESLVLRAGAEKFPYGTIVGAGSNAAILHATPSKRSVQKGDLVLVDAGADLHDYCVDITRVFSADGRFSLQQQSVYDVVLSAQAEAMQRCRPGVAWVDVHLTAARVIAEGLKSLKILNGDTDSLLESGAVSLFFPHGVGHMVGLKVRDVGGVYNANPRICNGVRLRVDLQMEEDFVMTVEPGLYFIPALLGDPDVRSRFGSQVHWSEVEKWREFGGIRIEDDVHITSLGPVNLTAAIAK